MSFLLRIFPFFLLPHARTDLSHKVASHFKTSSLARLRFRNPHRLRLHFRTSSVIAKTKEATYKKSSNVALPSALPSCSPPRKQSTLPLPSSLRTSHFKLAFFFSLSNLTQIFRCSLVVTTINLNSKEVEVGTGINSPTTTTNTPTTLAEEEEEQEESQEEVVIRTATTIRLVEGTIMALKTKTLTVQTKLPVHLLPTIESIK